MSHRSVLVCFLVSLLLFGVTRIPQLSDQLRSWQVGNTILLTTLEIWDSEGIGKHHFSPVQTWMDEGDKFHHAYHRLESSKGNNYYISLPPFTFWLAHTCFQLTDTAPSSIGLQIFGLALQLLGALGIFSFLKLLTGNSLAALTGFILFLFSPVLSFGYHFYFFSEIIGITLWTISAYYALKVASENKISWYFLLGIFNLIFILTDWTAVFFIGSAVLFFLLSRNLKAVGVMIFSGITGLTMIIFTYGSIAGLPDLFHAWKIRFFERTGHFGNGLSDQGLGHSNADTYVHLMHQFNHQLMWIGYALVAVVFIYIISRKWFEHKVDRSGKRVSFRPILFLLILPALIHQIAFLNASALHYVYQGKWAMVITVLVGWYVYLYQRSTALITRAIAACFLVAGLLASIKLEVPKDPDGEKLQAMAKKIKSEIEAGESVKIGHGSGVNTLYLSYLLKRNVVSSESASEGQ